MEVNTFKSMLDGVHYNVVDPKSLISIIERERAKNNLPVIPAAQGGGGKERRTDSTIKKDGKPKARAATALPSEYREAFYNALLSTRHGFRNYMVYMLQYGVGRRVSDIAKLRVGDVYDCDQRRAREYMYIVEKKTRISSTLYIPRPARDAIELYVEHLEEEGHRVTPASLLIRSQVQSKEGAVNEDAIGRLKESSVGRIYKQCAREVGIPEDRYSISSHTPRKTFAQDWSDKYGEIETISQYYGHKDVKTTRIYAQINYSSMVGKIKELLE